MKSMLFNENWWNHSKVSSNTDLVSYSSTTRIIGILTWLGGGPDGEWYPIDLPHDVFVWLVDLHEHPGLGRKLSLDVWGREYTLQVQPVPLAVQPLILKEQIKGFIVKSECADRRGSKVFKQIND